MTTRKKVVFFSHNVSGNCMFRTLLLYRALEPHYEVEIIGFDRGTGLWPPIRGESLNIRTAPLRGWRTFLHSSYRLLKPLQADLVIASKPRLPSFGLALLNRLFRGIPVIVDNEDDERAMTRPPAGVKLRTLLAFNLKNPDAYFATVAMHSLVPRADHVFCVSEYFRNIHGGSVVPHGLKPPPAIEDPHVVGKLRAELGLADAFVVVFVGTPRAHKGIVETLEASRLSGIPNIKVLVVGVSPEDAYTNSLSQEYGDILVRVPPRPYTEVPYYLALGDATVLAQKPSPESLGQMPAKLTDAMFAGIPIIATAISDIPTYLEGCGIVIPDPHPEKVAEALRWVFQNPAEAKELGSKALSVAQRRLSDQAIAETMTHAVNRLMHRGRRI